MPRTHLRVYYGPQEDEAPTQQNTISSLVNVRLGEILPLLVDAVRCQRTWLKDFEQEEITISLDLYEVLLAYQYYRRPSA
ncbi:hypothetical protein THTE_0135 [Thermogutta terrifontis]|jgi:hypothetical protein|uniref:Uncharacterized protein n=1 Tax=Thermogutta terrifontis TaxID=1331910 RepID=A0A286R9Y3_9BACT|nr:hypothetical protein [Thermogutta terrifontis]ASV72737.1 hypothetical protein THTE_0135 [Thermogutta terrifontis]